MTSVFFLSVVGFPNDLYLDPSCFLIVLRTLKSTYIRMLMILPLCSLCWGPSCSWRKIKYRHGASIQQTRTKYHKYKTCDLNEDLNVKVDSRQLTRVTSYRYVGLEVDKTIGWQCQAEDICIYSPRCPRTHSPPGASTKPAANMRPYYFPWPKLLRWGLGMYGEENGIPLSREALSSSQ